MTDLEGTYIRDYLIQKKLGMGAMSAVYRVRRISDDAIFAMKLMSWEMSADAHMVERFKMETDVLSRIHHPCLVRIFDYGQLTDGRLYYIMEYLEGETLAARMHRGSLTLGEILRFTRQLCEALDAIHLQGIVHRDLKPGNLFLVGQEPDIQLKLLDFGIAKVSGNGEVHELTSTGAILGTPVYMSPEQALAQNFQVTHLSDIYSLGVIVYKCLCGNFPIVGNQIPEVVAYHLLQDPIPISQFNPDIPKPLEYVIMRCLSKRPLERFGRAMEFFGVFDEACCGIPLDTVFEVKSMTDPDLLVSTNPWMHMSGQKASTMNCNPVETTTEHSHTEVTPSPENAARVPSANAAVSALLFVNRQQELSALQDFLGGHRICMEITGPAGIGKTELVRQFLFSLGMAWTIHKTIPAPEGKILSWQPILRLWRGMVLLPEDCMPSQVDAVCARLNLQGPILHALHLLLFGTPYPHQAGVPVLRRELADSLAQAVCMAAREHGCILFFDDFDDFDAMSQNVIRRIVAISDGNVRVIVTGTVSRLSPDPDLADRVVSMELAPLKSEDARHFLMQARQGRMDSRMHALLERSGGIPAHLVHGVRVLEEDAFFNDMGWLEILRRRCAILPPAQRRLLAWVAIHGGQMPASFVRDSGFLEEASCKSIPCLLERGFLELENDGLRIASAEIRSVVLSEMLPALRRQMKLLLLEHLRAAGTDPRILAFHSDGAESDAETAELYEACAIVAESMHDDAACAYCLSRFIALMGEEGWETRRRRLLRVHLQAAEMHRFLGDFHTAVELLQRALKHCGRQEEEWVWLNSSMARCLLETDPDAAMSRSREALRAAENFDDPKLLHRVHFDFGKAALRTECFHEGAIYLDDGIRKLRNTGSWLLWELELLLATCQFRLGWHPLALETVRDSLKRAEEAGSIVAQARLHELESRICLGNRDAAGAAEAALRAVAALRIIGDRHALVEAKLLLAQFSPNAGDWAQAALDLAQSIGYRDGVRQARLLLQRTGE